MKDANVYYYNQLNKQQQKAYHAMKTGLLSMAPSFSVPKLDGKDLADIYFLLRLDCPEIFYTDKFSYRYYQDAENVEMIPEYLFPKKKNYISMISSVKTCDMINSKSRILMKSSDR